MKKLLSLILVLTFLLSFAVINVSAVCSLSVAPSKSTVYVGDKFSVTFTFTGGAAIGSADVIIDFNTDKFQYVSISGGMKGLATNVNGRIIQISDYDASNTSKTYKFTITFKALAVGSGVIAVTSSDISDTDYNSLGAPSGSTNVSIKQENKSSNANLKSLTVPKGCTLVPAFSKNVTSYTCTVPGSVTSFPLDWETEDPKAKEPVVSGAVNLKVGENTRTVTVTAEDGTKKVYTIKITRLQPDSTPTPTKAPNATPGTSPSEEPENVTPTPFETPQPLTVKVNDKEYAVSTTITLTLPDGFRKTTVMFETEDIEAAISGEKTLIQLNDGEDSILCLYDEQTKEVIPYKIITSKSETFTLVDEKPEVLPENLQATTLNIDGVVATVWPITQFGEGYYILHVMNDQGVKYPAVYCAEDGTIQKLSLKLFEESQAVIAPTSTPEILISATPDNKPLFDFNEIDLYLVAAVACGVVLVVLIIIVIIAASKNGKKKKVKQPKREWGFEDPYDINIELEEPQPTEQPKSFSDDDEDFS